MNTAQAIELARDGLLWLAGQPEEFAHFMAATGIGPSDVRSGATDPEFLGFLLDFMLGRDDMAREFCASSGIAGDTLMRARATLPGGSAPDWT